jgi:hypothetical protein
MAEIWLRSNRRIFVLGLVPGAAICAAAIGLIYITPVPALRYFAIGVLLVALFLLTKVVRQLMRPRVAYVDGQVLFYLRVNGPIAVPVEVVEAFFLGQGPAYLPGTEEDSQETINLVARLSQKAPEWQHVEVKPALGNWCEGYVSIRGTWCEPLTNDVVRRLNRRLSEVSRELAEQAERGQTNK